MSRVAVVTGAGSGIGRAVARALLDDGWDVALLGRTEASLRETGRDDRSALVLPTDVVDEAQVASAFAAVRDRYGRVDLLVNNAGSFGPSGTVDEVSVADWRATLDVNLTGTFLCARAAFGLMRAQQPRGGRIVNNGSISAQVPRPRQAAYAASKHAVTGLSKALALDGRALDIAVTQLDIGNTATAMTAGIGAGALQPDGSRRPEATFDVRHVAQAVVDLARLPLDVSVPWLTMMAREMPYAGRG